MLRPVAAALLALMLVAAGCSDGDDPDDLSAVTSIPDDEPTSSTTTAPRTVAPDVIPDDESLITEDYVEQVLRELSRSANEVLVSVRAAGVVDERALAIVQATSTETRSVATVNALADAARIGFEGYVDDPQPAQYTVRSVQRATAECIVVEAEADSSGALVDPPPPVVVRSTLVPASAAQRSSGLNSTAWVLAGSVPVAGGSDEDLCNQ